MERGIDWESALIENGTVETLDFHSLTLLGRADGCCLQSTDGGGTKQ